MKVLAQPIAFIVLALFWFPQDASLRVTEVISPTRSSQLSMMMNDITIVTVEIDDHQERADMRIVAGQGLFRESALEALKSWKFVKPSNGRAARTTVTFLFRPPVAEAIKLSLPVISGAETVGDRAAVPALIVDPGYPPICLGDGTSILEVFVNREGIVTGINALAGPPAFFETAKETVKRWKFSPARTSGQPVASRSYVVISFVRPTT